MSLLDALGSIDPAVVVTQAVPLILAALGALLTQRAGILNVGVEGLMLTASFASVAVAGVTGNLLWGVLAGIGSAILMALLLAVVTLYLGADFIVAGIGTNLLAAGVTLFLLETFFGSSGSYQPAGLTRLPAVSMPWLEGIPIVGQALGSASVLVWVTLVIVVATALLLTRTRFGRYVDVVGEAEDAAEAAGIPVRRVKLWTVLYSGLVSGVAGSQIALGTLGFFLVNMTNGRGFIGLAAMFLGGAGVWASSLAGLLFGYAGALSDSLQVQMNLPSQLVLMLPYLTALVALVFPTVLHLRRRRRAQAGPRRPGGTQTPVSAGLASEPEHGA